MRILIVIKNKFKFKINRFGIGVNTSKIDTYFQLHWAQLFDIPDKAQFGAGMLYYRFNHSQNAGAFVIS